MEGLARLHGGLVAVERGLQDGHRFLVDRPASGMRPVDQDLAGAIDGFDVTDGALPHGANGDRAFKRNLLPFHRPAPVQPPWKTPDGMKPFRILEAVAMGKLERSGRLAGCRSAAMRPKTCDRG